MSRPARSERPLPTLGSSPEGGAPSFSARAELRGVMGEALSQLWHRPLFPGVASRRASPTCPIGCIRDVGFESPVTGPDDDGFLPPGMCRPVRAIQIPDGGSRESRNAGLVGAGGWGPGREPGGRDCPQAGVLGGSWDSPLHHSPLLGAVVGGGLYCLRLESLWSREGSLRSTRAALR